MPPAIFTPENREKIREMMLENGLGLMKRHGYKKTAVEDITKATGVAKGTFYNFFTSKETFIEEMVREQGKKLLRRYLAIGEEQGYLSREAFGSLLREMALEEDAPVSYLTKEDLGLIEAKLPGAGGLLDEADVRVFEAVLLLIPERPDGCDPRILANYVRMAQLARRNGGLLCAGELDRTLERMLEDAAGYVFGAVRRKRVFL